MALEVGNKFEVEGVEYQVVSSVPKDTNNLTEFSIVPTAELNARGSAPEGGAPAPTSEEPETLHPRS